MNNAKRIGLNLLLGVVTCLFLVGIATTPSFSNAEPRLNPLRSVQPTSNLDLFPQQIAANLQDATSASMAQAQGTSNSSVTRYVAVLTKNGVVAANPSTSAFGSAGAVLTGDQLIVRGDYSNLSTALRDYATDPLDPPNPAITSGIHIHQGDSTANGPFQYALEVSPEQSQLAGRFSGAYTLTSEQVQALSEGKLYVDIHTKQNRAGELRGIFQPY